MAWKYIDTVEEDVDLSGALRVRILCEKDGTKECFFLKFDDDSTEEEIDKGISDFLAKKSLESTNVTTTKVFCPNCGFKITS